MNLEIESYYKTSKLIHVESLLNGKEKHYKFTRLEFEEWLENDDRLDWISDSSDYRGEHEQQTGKLSIVQYWSGDWKTIYKDFKDFIEIKYSDNVFSDIKKSIDKITNT